LNKARTFICLIFCMFLMGCSFAFAQRVIPVSAKTGVQMAMEMKPVLLANGISFDGPVRINDGVGTAYPHTVISIVGQKEHPVTLFIYEDETERASSILAMCDITDKKALHDMSMLISVALYGLGLRKEEVDQLIQVHETGMDDRRSDYWCRSIGKRVATQIHYLRDKGGVGYRILAYEE